LWIYYSAQILFLGAEFTQVYARRYGSRLQPAEGAERMTEEARAQQGIPHRNQEQSGKGQRGGSGTREPVPALTIMPPEPQWQQPRSGLVQRVGKAGVLLGSLLFGAATAFGGSKRGASSAERVRSDG
jgi:hypothetical protein